MAIYRLLGAVLVVSLGSGCAGPYQPSANDVMVPVKYMGWGSPSMCKDGKLYNLHRAENSDAYQVPSGQLIAFGTRMHSSGYNVSYTCSPWLAFIPEAGRIYVANGGLVSQGRCFIELVREDETKETGVALEPSVTRASACVAPSAAASAPR